MSTAQKKAVAKVNLAAAARLGAPPMGAPESLMKDHGLLNRILLVYKNLLERYQKSPDEPLHSDELSVAANLMLRYIHGYHEEMEEKFIFLRLKREHLLTPLIDVLWRQHWGGKTLTLRLVAATAAARRHEVGAQRVQRDMAAFVRMYEPHEAREDTVVFPAWRDLVSDREFDVVREKMDAVQERVLGERGFAGALSEISAVERSLGIFRLAQYTPNVPGINKPVPTPQHPGS
ncbi:hemerythrin domain-containing protein [Streptomyces noursei]